MAHSYTTSDQHPRHWRSWNDLTVYRRSANQAGDRLPRDRVPMGQSGRPHKRTIFLVNGEGTWPTPLRHDLQAKIIRPFDRLSLLVAGDVEPNPGPTDHQQCIECGKPLKRNPIKCSDDKCNIMSHQTCSGISRYKPTPWLCPEHRPSGSSPLPLPSGNCPDQQLVRQTCSVCRKPIRKGVDRLLCSVLECKNSSHKGEKCSGLNRYAVTLWKCGHHQGGTQQHRASPLDSTPGNALPKPATKTNCKGCKGPIRSDTSPIPCASCKAFFHKKCTKLSRLMLEMVGSGQTTWSCPKCKHLNDPHNFTRTLGGSAVESSAQDQKKTSKACLRVLQWNANGISPKVHELEERLTREDYDLCLLQETKLRSGMPTPRIKGYTSIRLDRPREDGGGGLMSYIRNSLAFERVQETHDDGTELSSFRVKIGKRKWASFYNLYCPPSRSHTASTRLKLDGISSEPDTIIMGDFNAHSQLWDRHQPDDERGERILDWTFENNLTVLNDGSVTRTTVRSTPTTSTTRPLPEGKSSPDLTICGATWSDKCIWHIAEGIGSSDHLPISITINTDVSHGNIFKGQANWKSSGVNWELFSTELDLAMVAMDSLPPTLQSTC